MKFNELNKRTALSSLMVSLRLKSGLALAILLSCLTLSYVQGSWLQESWYDYQEPDSWSQFIFYISWAEGKTEIDARNDCYDSCQAYDDQNDAQTFYNCGFRVRKQNSGQGQGQDQFHCMIMEDQLINHSHPDYSHYAWPNVILNSGGWLKNHTIASGTHLKTNLQLSLSNDPAVLNQGLADCLEYCQDEAYVLNPSQNYTCSQAVDGCKLYQIDLNTVQQAQTGVYLYENITPKPRCKIDHLHGYYKDQKGEIFTMRKDNTFTYSSGCSFYDLSIIRLDGVSLDSVMQATNGKCPDTQEDCIVISFKDMSLYDNGYQTDFRLNATHSSLGQTFIFGVYSLTIEKTIPYTLLQLNQSLVEVTQPNSTEEVSQIQLNVTKTPPVCADYFENQFAISSVLNDQDQGLAQKDQELIQLGLGRGWLHVRHTASKPDSEGRYRWGNFTDQLNGTDHFGDPSNQSDHWTMKFDHIQFDQFLFASLDLEKWMIMDESVVREDTYSFSDLRHVQSSSDHINHETWVSHDKQPNRIKHPWISINDFKQAGAQNKILYGAGSNHYGQGILKYNGGADVYIRNSTQDAKIVSVDSENITISVPSDFAIPFKFDLFSTSNCTDYQKFEDADISDSLANLVVNSSDECKVHCDKQNEQCLSFEYNPSIKRCYFNQGSVISGQSVGWDGYVKKPYYMQRATQITIIKALNSTESSEESSISSQEIQNRTFQISNNTEIFSFDAFKCSDNCNMSYKISLSNDSSSTVCSSNNTGSIQGLTILVYAPSDPFIIVRIDTSETKKYEFYIWAFKQGNCSVNSTSKAVSIEIADYSESGALSQINFPPQFADGDPQGMKYEWSNQTEIVYQLPEISQENGESNVTIQMAGLNETSVTFDQDTMRVRFFNFSESRNVTLEIELRDKNELKSLYEVKFEIVVLKTQNQTSENDEEDDKDDKKHQSQGDKPKSTFRGVVIDELIDSEDQGLDEQKAKKDEQKRLTSTKVSSQGDFELLFSENLKIPQKVTQLLRQEKKRLLEENQTLQNNSCDDQPKPNPLDIYLMEAIEVRVLKFDEETKTYVPDEISFDINFRNWTETGLSFVFNFTDPLQISRNSKQDKSEIRILNEKDFVSKDSNQVVYKVNHTIPLTVKIPKQLTFGLTEEEIVEQFQTAAKFGVGFTFFKIATQMILKGSQKEMMPLFLSVQAVSCITLYGVSLPAHTEIVLNEIRKLIEFQQLEPKSLYIMMKAVRQSKKQLISYEQAYENQEQLFEEEDHFFKRLNFTITFIVLAIGFLIVSGVLFSCKRSREYLKPKIQKKIKGFFWNGFILCIEIGYVGYCIMFVKILKEDESQSGLKVFKLVVLGTLIASVPIISLFKLIRTSNEVLTSKREKKKTGELIDKLILRKDSWKEKVNFPIQQTLKAAIVFCSLIKPTSIQLISVNLFIFIEMISVIKIQPYDLKKRERMLRISIRYFVQVCFLNQFFFVGRFVDEDVDPKDLVIPCGKDKPIIKMVYEGYLTDTNTLHYMGSLQIALFVLLCLPSFAIMILGCLKKSQLKKFRKQYLSLRINVLVKERFEEEQRSCSMQKYQLIRLRVQKQNMQIQRYVRYLTRMLSKSQKVQSGRQMGQIERNHRELQKIKYASQLFVLKSREMIFEEGVMGSKRKEVRAQVERLLEEQQKLASEGLVRIDGSYVEDFRQDYFFMTKYQIMDFIDKEIAKSQEPGQQQKLSLDISSSSDSSESSESSESKEESKREEKNSKPPQKQVLDQDLKIKEGKRDKVQEKVEIKQEKDQKPSPKQDDISKQEDSQKQEIRSEQKISPKQQGTPKQEDSPKAETPTLIELKTKKPLIKNSIMQRCQNKGQVKPILKPIEEENGLLFTLSRPQVIQNKQEDPFENQEKLLEEIDEMINNTSQKVRDNMKEEPMVSESEVMQMVPTPMSKNFKGSSPKLWEQEKTPYVVPSKTTYDLKQSYLKKKFEMEQRQIQIQQEEIFEKERESKYSYEKAVEQFRNYGGPSYNDNRMDQLSNDIDDLISGGSLRRYDNRRFDKKY